jgi:hypothetical protein
VEPHSAYIRVFFATWIALGIGGSLWVWSVKKPDAKRRLLRGLSIGAALLFSFFVWLITRDPRQLAFISVPLLLIALLNHRLVKVCDECASISRPQGLTMPVHCHKCGAVLK